MFSLSLSLLCSLFLFLFRFGFNFLFFSFVLFFWFFATFIYERRPQLNFLQLLIFRIRIRVSVSTLIISVPRSVSRLPFLLQLQHMLEPVRSAQRIQLQVRAEVRTKTFNCTAGQWPKSVHGHVLVSQLLRLHDSRKLSEEHRNRPLTGATGEGRQAGS